MTKYRPHEDSKTIFQGYMLVIPAHTAQSMSWQTVKSIVDSLHVNELHRLPSCLEPRLFTSFVDESHGSRAKKTASILNHLFLLKHTYYMGISISAKKTSEKIRLHGLGECPIISSQPPHHHTRPPPKGYCIFCRH